MIMLSIIFTTVILLYIIGFYYLITTRNLIRILIAIEVIAKGVTLTLIYVGKLTGQMATAQSMVITLIIIEVVVMAVAAGIIIGIYLHTNSLDVRDILKKEE
jgi:multisubunit Na+/H+ antiporter MnhC subunit